MKNLKDTVIVTTCLVVVLVLQSCIAGKQLSPGSADPTNVKGIYTLILYGCITQDDVANVAILVDETSGYTFDVDAIAGMYKVKKGIHGAQALSEANTFDHCGMHSVWKTQLRSIPDPTGKIIAYELKPLYEPFEFKYPEVLLSSYYLSDHTVTARFTLDPSAQRSQNPMRMR
jgi:hypothetical protein